MHGPIYLDEYDCVVRYSRWEGVLYCETHDTYPNKGFVDEWDGCKTGRWCDRCGASGGTASNPCLRCGGERYVHPATDAIIDAEEI